MAVKSALCLTLALSAWLLHPTEVRPDTTADCSHIQAMPGSVSTPLKGYRDETDMLVLAPASNGRVMLCYHNHPAMVSGNGVHTLTLGNIEVLVQVIIGHGKERLSISPPDGWMVYPADLADAEVIDGEAVTVMLFAGMM